MNSICRCRQQATAQTEVGGVGVHIQEGGLSGGEVSEGGAPSGVLLSAVQGKLSGHLETRRR